MFVKVKNQSKPKRIPVRVIKSQIVGHRATIGHSLFVHPSKVNLLKKMAGRV